MSAIKDVDKFAISNYTGVQPPQLLDYKTISDDLRLGKFQVKNSHTETYTPSEIREMNLPVRSQLARL